MVTEYVLKVYPRFENILTGQATLYAANDSTTGDAAWTALANTMASLPDLMDDGIAGSVIALTGSTTQLFLPSVDLPSTGIAAVAQLIAYNTTVDAFDRHIQAFIEKIREKQGSPHGIQMAWSGASIGNTSYPASIAGTLSSHAGGGSVASSRLLGRSELSLPVVRIEEYLRRVMANEQNGSMLVIGLQGGKGVHNVPNHMRGAVNPVWRSTYLHCISYSTATDQALPPEAAIKKAGEWAESHLEPIWRDWAPFTGSYMNEANPFNSNWKHDFYGVHYDRLASIKKKYDPTESLFVLNGIGSEKWSYDLSSGRLCTVT